MDGPLGLSSDIVDVLKFFSLFVTLKVISEEATEAGTLRKNP
jgi:hypothetical protein